MTFTRSELEMIYQYAATDRAATVAGLAEIVPVLKDPLTKAIVKTPLTSWRKSRSRSAAALSLISKPVSLKNGTTLSGGLPKQRHRRKSRLCRGMTLRVLNAICHRTGT